MGREQEVVGAPGAGGRGEGEVGVWGAGWGRESLGVDPRASVGGEGGERGEECSVAHSVFRWVTTQGHQERWVHTTQEQQEREEVGYRVGLGDATFAQKVYWWPTSQT